MEQPNIEKQIKKNGNLLSGFGAFLLLGAVTTSTLNASLAPTLMLCGGLIPFAIDVFSLKLLIEMPEKVIHDLSLLGKPFRKRVSKWVKNYIDDSESLTEKKYKVGCLSLWMRHKRMEVENFMDISILSDLSQELSNKKEMQQSFSLSYLFGDSRKGLKDVFNIDATVLAFLENDKNDSQKIEIAQKVYKEYSNIGMAGQAFVMREPYKELLILQDYKFTKEDYGFIDAYVDIVKKGNMKHSSHVLTKELFSEEAVGSMSKVIDREDNIDNLKKLGNYCSNLGHRTDFEPLVPIIKNKIEYLQLASELEVKDVEDKPKAKKMKV
jgi:hypothetical protein